MIEAAVLTISDSVCAGTRTDRSGPVLVERLRSMGWCVPVAEALPDEAAQISARLAALADSGQVGVIFTTGGTGVAPRDVTPEATRAVLDREMPGLGEAMRASGRLSTPLAVVSRATAGTRGRTLIVNFPGSPRAALESLDAIVEVVPHVLDLLRGRTEHPAQPERAGNR